jgi:NAD(P)-dependent dehydrogenase (short-subunit alcohol dehydrogenase family)
VTGAAAGADGAAKAGLIRFTSSLAGLREAMNVRVNCVVPDWIATERAVAELAGMSEEVLAATPAPIGWRKWLTPWWRVSATTAWRAGLWCCGGESPAVCSTRVGASRPAGCGRRASEVDLKQADA